MADEAKDELPGDISPEVLAEAGPAPEIPSADEADARILQDVRNSSNNQTLQLDEKELAPRRRGFLNGATRAYNQWVAKVRKLQAAADAEKNPQQSETTDNRPTNSADKTAKPKGKVVTKAKAKAKQPGPDAGKKAKIQGPPVSNDEDGSTPEYEEGEYEATPEPMKAPKLVRPSWADEAPKGAGGELDWAKKGFAMEALRKEDKKMAKKKRKRRKKRRRRRRDDYSDESSDSSESGPEWCFERGGRRRRHKTTLQLSIERTPGDKTGAHTMDFLELSGPSLKDFGTGSACVCLRE